MMRIIQHREGGTPSYWRFTAEVATVMPKMAMAVPAREVMTRPGTRALMAQTQPKAREAELPEPNTMVARSAEPETFGGKGGRAVGHGGEVGRARSGSDEGGKAVGDGDNDEDGRR